MNTTDEPFGDWLARVALAAGYDTTPGAKGRSDLAKAIGADPSVIGKALSGKRPHIDTQVKLAKALDVEVRDMLIHSGTLKAEDLPQPHETPPPATSEMDLYDVARKYGVPAAQADLFVKSVEAVARTFADGSNGTTISGSRQTGGLSAEG